MITGTDKNGGFLLMELVPALVFFGSFLLLATRLFWAGMGMEASAWQSQRIEDAFMRTWRVWMVGGGRAALAIQEKGEGWSVFDFPTDAWLPEGGERVSGEEEVRFRRRRIDNTPGGSNWQVEVMKAGSTNWQWYRSIFEGVVPAGHSSP